MCVQNVCAQSSCECTRYVDSAPIRNTHQQLLCTFGLQILHVIYMKMSSHFEPDYCWFEGGRFDVRVESDGSLVPRPLKRTTLFDSGSDKTGNVTIVECGRLNLQSWMLIWIRYKLHISPRGLLLLSLTSMMVTARTKCHLLSLSVCAEAAARLGCNIPLFWRAEGLVCASQLTDNIKHLHLQLFAVRWKQVISSVPLLPANTLSPVPLHVEHLSVWGLITGGLNSQESSFCAHLHLCLRPSAAPTSHCYIYLLINRSNWPICRFKKIILSKHKKYV